MPFKTYYPKVHVWTYSVCIQQKIWIGQQCSSNTALFLSKNKKLPVLLVYYLLLGLLALNRKRNLSKYSLDGLLKKQMAVGEKIPDEGAF